MEAQAVMADMLGERAALSAHAARARQDQAQSPREAWPASSPNSTQQEIKKASAAKLASGALGRKLRQKIHLLARPAYLEVAKPESYRPETYRPEEDGDPSRAATKRELVASFDRRVAEQAALDAARAVEKEYRPRVIGPIAPPRGFDAEQAALDAARAAGKQAQLPAPEAQPRRARAKSWTLAAVEKGDKTMTLAALQLATPEKVSSAPL